MIELTKPRSFERCLYKNYHHMLMLYFLKKGFNAQNSLLKLLEKVAEQLY